MSLTQAFGKEIRVGVAPNIRQGTFEPTVEDSSLSDEGQTFAIQDGSYTRIANRVFFDLRIKMAGMGIMNVPDQLRIGGWPFAIGANSIGTAILGQAVGSNMPAAGQPVTFEFDPVQNRLLGWFLNTVQGHSALTIFHLSSDGDFKISGHYETDDA